MLPEITKSIRLIVVGGRNANKLAAELEDNDDVDLVDLSEIGWKVTEANIEAKREELAAGLNFQFKGPTMIIFLLPDNFRVVLGTV